MRRAALAAILVLLAIRLPSLVQPAGGDQGLYLYAGQRLIAGDVMYRDVWDQKPPAVAFVYGTLWRIWPHESIVPGIDLVLAAGVAWLLVVLGRRRFSPAVGYTAAIVFLLFGDPYFQRLSGIYVRGQCEPFMAFAVTVALALIADRARRPAHLAAAGVALAAAFWLKYNAVTYGLVAVAAVVAWRQPRAPRSSIVRDVLWIGCGFAAISLGVLAFFASRHALGDLRLATIDYNLQYANETYEGRSSVLAYLLTFPLARARYDMLWLLGGVGLILLALRNRFGVSSWVALAWVVSAILSIAVNGSRGAPNYFVQASPAVALAAAAGLSTLLQQSRQTRAGVATLLLVSLIRVGTDAPVWHMRLWSLPGLIANVRHDLAYARGRIDRDAYLRRFKGVKHDALENERLVEYIGEATTPADPVFVFGFSGGTIGWKSGRRSPSRFFWSRPVFIEFAADRPGYGSRGLLADLERRPPALVVLQKDEWRSRDHFMANDALRAWLERGYAFERESPMFVVWKRK
jgi:hypothetical protein